MGILRQLTRKIRGPRCHLDSDEKAWVERRLLWLNAQFGSEPIRRAPLDPDSQLLPSQWDGSYEAGADLLERLCNHMLVESLKWTPIFGPLAKLDFSGFAGDGKPAEP